MAGAREALMRSIKAILGDRETIVVARSASVADAARLMSAHHIGALPVLEHDRLVGIFTERDVLRKVIFRDGNQTWKVDSVMTPNPETLPPTASVAYALNKMSVDGYRHIPIVDRIGRAIGVLSVKDIVHFVVDFFPAGVLNLPHDPGKAIPRTTDGG